MSTTQLTAMPENDILSEFKMTNPILQNFVTQQLTESEEQIKYCLVLPGFRPNVRQDYVF